MKILCFLGLHKWWNYAFDKEPHEPVTKSYQECFRCKKRRTVKHSKEDFYKKLC